MLRETNDLVAKFLNDVFRGVYLLKGFGFDKVYIEEDSYNLYGTSSKGLTFVVDDLDKVDYITLSSLLSHLVYFEGEVVDKRDIYSDSDLLEPQTLIDRYIRSRGVETWT